MSNTTRLILLAALGAGAYYWFKVRPQSQQTAAQLPGAKAQTQALPGWATADYSKVNLSLQPDAAQQFNLRV